MKYLLILLTPLLFAKEPIIMKLSSIYANDIFLLNYKQSSYYCEPYGVISIAKIKTKKDINPTCKKAFEDFIVKNPKLNNFAKYHLHVEQYYRVDFKSQGKCLLFSKGKKTYSQDLLLNGLAILKPNFKDEEYRYIFLKSYKSAKMRKKGIWKVPTLRTCIAEMFKE